MPCFGLNSTKILALDQKPSFFPRLHGLMQLYPSNEFQE
jgi:hypothetical protein